MRGRRRRDGALINFTGVGDLFSSDIGTRARARKSIAATNTRSGDSRVVKLVIALSRTLEARRSAGPKGKEGARPILWGTRVSRGGPDAIGSIMPCWSVSPRVSTCSALHGRRR